MIVPPGLAGILGAGAGAILGSFLATLILRLPQGRSPFTGRSACDGCGRTLGATELIPVISAIVMRGRCRTCGGRIDPLHLHVELASAAVGGVLMFLMPSVAGIGWTVMGLFLLTLAVLDWRHFWLPDVLTLPLAFLGLTLGLWTSAVPLADRVIGAAAGYGALLAIALAYRRLRGREGLGLGDAKLLGAIGAWLGWRALPFLLLIASALALLFVLGAKLSGRDVDGATRLPLGSFLCLAVPPTIMTLWLFHL